VSAAPLRAIATGAAPAAIGPYSQAIAAGPLLFACGQLGADPSTGKIVPGGIEAETEQALRNLAGLLAAAGTGLAAVAKVTIFLADLESFAAMNAVYARHFAAPHPARTTVAVRALPLGAAIEIDAIAYLGMAGATP
jgi:2-iminobutanoate/2-iminopropanoate deaminase